MRTRDFRDLKVWQKSMDLTTAVYQLTDRFPASERFGLTSQLRRACVSVPANIAEGNQRLHRGDYVRFISIARGSAGEIETLLELARRLRYLRPEDAIAITDRAREVGRMLTGLSTSLRTSP